MMVGQLSSALLIEPCIRGRPTGSHGTGLARGHWGMDDRRLGQVGASQGQGRARPWQAPGKGASDAGVTCFTPKADAALLEDFASQAW